MPIDIRLLRTPEDAARVSHWQTLRQDTDSDSTLSVTMTVQHLDQTNRQALKTLNSYKSQCRQGRQRPDPERLQSHQQDCLLCQEQLEQELYRLGNFVDENLLTEMEPYYKEDNVGDSNKKGLLHTPFRHLLEIQAFDCSNNSALQLQSGVFYPTGIAMDWARALSCHWEACIAAVKNTSRIELPMSLPLSAQHLHDMMGCNRKTHVSAGDDDHHNGEGSCHICWAVDAMTSHDAAMLLQAPSWMGYLKDRYGDQTLGDKQLPLTVCYQTTTMAHAPDLAFDGREQWRCDSWGSLLPSSNIPTSTASINYQVLILTSSTYYDSRTVQKEWANKMVSFYTSLLKPSSSSHTMFQESTTATALVRKRVVSPPQLLPAEASRIAIEGYLPSPGSDIEGHNDDNRGRWVILAYLSNFSDYPTRACRIKNNPQQFCHVLQGMVCSLLEVMCWQASLTNHGDGDHDQQNASNIELGVWLPAKLASHFPHKGTIAAEDGSIILPRRKVFEKTKHGRLQLNPAQRGSAKKSQAPPVDGGEAAAASSKARPTTTRLPKDESGGGVHVAQTNNSREKDPPGAPRRNTDAIVLSSSASPGRAMERIRAEALSSPYGFLPFYNS